MFYYHFFLTFIPHLFFFSVSFSQLLIAGVGSGLYVYNTIMRTGVAYRKFAHDSDVQHTMILPDGYIFFYQYLLVSKMQTVIYCVGSLLDGSCHVLRTAVLGSGSFRMSPFLQSLPPQVKRTFPEIRFFSEPFFFG